MKQHYGPDYQAQSYTDKFMSFNMVENREKTIQETAQRFEQKVKQDLIAALEARNG